MTVDPRVEAAARAAVRGYTGDEDDWLDWKGLALVVLAAADAVERPVAQRLADALQAAVYVMHEGTDVRLHGRNAEPARCRNRHCVEFTALLAEWDATQEAK